jgi:hypothetical protein
MPSTDSSTFFLSREIAEHLSPRFAELHAEWSAPKPFPYVIIDDFFPDPVAKELADSFPSRDDPDWSRDPHPHQHFKQFRDTNFPGPIGTYFQVTADDTFSGLVSAITGIPDLKSDPDLAGGGCHQILRGGFLDVHVDFNRHHKLGLERRLNLIVYLSRDWHASWGGELEFWDMSDRRRLEAVLPQYNRAVLFETSDRSYHGHPRPLACPEEATRDSLAVYYYTGDRPHAFGELSPEHNTIFRNTRGLRGLWKSRHAYFLWVNDRVRTLTWKQLLARSARKISRKLRRLPPENS